MKNILLELFQFPPFLGLCPVLHGFKAVSNAIAYRVLDHRLTNLIGEKQLIDVVICIALIMRVVSFHMFQNNVRFFPVPVFYCVVGLFKKLPFWWPVL